jgi:hypothetical protein
MQAGIRSFASTHHQKAPPDSEIGHGLYEMHGLK